MTDVTLKKGTWFYYRDRGNSNLVEILDYEQDTERADLHWFKCLVRFDLANGVEMGEETTFSSRNFEQFEHLELFTEERGREILETRVRQLREDRPSIMTQIERASEAAPMLGRLSRDTEAEVRTEEDSEEEVSYRERSVFRPSLHVPHISAKDFKTPLGSGDMKSILKLYEANPETSWDAVDTIINETGHLLLTYTNNNTRQNIINQKLTWLNQHHSITLECNSMYNLNYKGKITTAIYIGNYHWAMHRSIDNDIDNMVGGSFMMIPKETMISFMIDEVNIEDHRNKYQLILDTTISEIDPETFSELRESTNNEVYCLSDSQTTSIPKKDVSKNWGKAFTYNYYIGGNMDTRLDLKNLDDVASIEKLAMAREDTEVLAALA